VKQRVKHLERESGIRRAAAFAKTPPGTLKIGKNLYFDKTPVSIIAWREYMFYKTTKYGRNSA
jgi:hypothetical protein